MNVNWKECGKGLSAGLALGLVAYIVYYFFFYKKDKEAENEHDDGNDNGEDEGKKFLNMHLVWFLLGFGAAGAVVGCVRGRRSSMGYGWDY